MKGAGEVGWRRNSSCRTVGSGDEEGGVGEIMVGKKQFSPDASTIFPQFTAVLLLSLIPPFLPIRFTFLILSS